MVRWSETEYELFNKKRKKSKPKKTNKPRQTTVIVGGYKSNWSGKVSFGGQRNFYRSLWEHNYARFLEWQKSNGIVLRWEHEPRRFCFKNHYSRGPYDYLPDFKVYYTDGRIEWHEVKGYLDSKSKSKIKRFEKHYPEEGGIVLIGRSWFSSMKDKKNLIYGWLSLEDARKVYPIGS